MRPLNDKEASLGHDPELGDKQTLKEVKWHSLESVKDDLHVAKVLEAMKLKVLEV